MEFSNLIYERRSIRSFKNEPLTEAQIYALIDSAIQAPNACNMQSWHFYVIQNIEVKEKLNFICPKWATAAPVMIVVCTNSETLEKKFGERGKNLFAIQDTAAAVENILLRAVDMELGGCWIGAFNENKCSEILNIPPKHRPVAIISVGVPAEKPEKRERKSIASVTTFI